MLSNVDPLAVLRKAIKLHEHLASKEQAKGKRANLQRMAECMRIAADLSVDLAQLEAKLGIVSRGDRVDTVQVEFVATDAQLVSLKDQVAALKAELEQARAGPREGAGAFNPTTNVPEPPEREIPDNNEVVLQESLIERKRRNEVAMGVRTGGSFDPTVSGRAGHTRFDIDGPRW